MSRLFLLALLALVGLASGFAPVNTPSVVGKFNSGSIGGKHEEKKRESTKEILIGDGPRPSVVFRDGVDGEMWGERPGEETGGSTMLCCCICIYLLIGCGGLFGGRSLYPRRAKSF